MARTLPLSIALCLTASPVLAEEVLNCVDTQVVGFKWDKAGKVQRADFVENRYTVKVLSDTQRIITRTVGDTAGSSHTNTCYKPYGVEGQIACDDGSGAEPWLFHRNTYTRAFLSGPPAGGSGGDRNIFVAHGTCTKF